MALTLRIENETSLPDGGPLAVTIQGTRGIDIGRDQYLDWTLPDPSRFISGRHCEIRWHDGAYWLHDISTNGTFLDGADGRLKAPHKLRDGDRFSIGHYIVVAAIDDADLGAAPEMRSAGSPRYDELWDPVGEAAPPIDPKMLKASRDLQPIKPDFLHWAIDVSPGYAPPSDPPPGGRGSTPWDAPSLASSEDMSWSQGAPKPAPSAPPEVIPAPTPRRPVWVTGEPNGPWAAPAHTDGSVAATAETSDASMLVPERSARERSASPYEGRGSETGGGAHQIPASDFVRLVARGAGLPEDALAGRDPAELAEELGRLMHLVAENMKQLLEARQQAKRLVRSTGQTTIQALDNNPLKFAPTAEDAMQIMFGPPTRSYLDAHAALTQGFGDLKIHQVKTFSAMQHALRRLLSDFDPEAIENGLTGDRGLAGVVGSRKARLWENYVARWQARTQNQEDGLTKAFMDYFAESYDRDGNGL